MLYHINLNTGIPSVCYAYEGNCPYGGDNEHFHSLGEAEAFANQIMEEKFPMFANAEEDEDWSSEVGFSQVVSDHYPDKDIQTEYTAAAWKEAGFYYLNRLSTDEIVDEIRLGDKQELVTSILKGEVLEDHPDYQTFLDEAIASQIYPDEIKSSLAEDSSLYTNNFIRKSLEKQEFSQQQIFDMAKTNDDYRMKEEIITNKQFSQESITALLGEDGLTPAPNWYLYLGYSPNLTKGTVQYENIQDRRRIAQSKSKGGILRG